MRRLPRPFIQLEALRGDPFSFAAVGTKIVATHYSTKKFGFCDECTTMPIVDVRSRGVNFGPSQMYHSTPIYITIGDRLFSPDFAGALVRAAQGTDSGRFPHHEHGAQLGVARPADAKAPTSPPTPCTVMDTPSLSAPPARPPMPWTLQAQHQNRACP
jgi:hypothetical protein